MSLKSLMSYEHYFTPFNEDGTLDQKRWKIENLPHGRSRQYLMTVPGKRTTVYGKKMADDTCRGRSVAAAVVATT